MSKQTSRWDDDKLFGGFIWGLLIGGLVALFRGPRIKLNPQDVGEAVKDVTTDPLRRGIAEGKVAAQRRQDALNAE